MFFDIFCSLCERNRITKNRAAMEIGLSNSTVTKWKKTGATPEGATLSKIASYFDVSIDFLLGKTPDAYLLVTEYQLSEAEKAYEKETDADKKMQIALEIDALRESLEDQRLGNRLMAMQGAKKAPTTKGEREVLTEDGHHIGYLYDQADEKDKMLTHSVLDKYDSREKIVSISTKTRNPGGMVEFDVFDEPAAAGFGNYLDAPKSHREQFPAFLIPKGADFGIRISGDSMEPLIRNGDTVFVKQSMTVESGKVGIFILNGESFCKRLIVDRQKKEVLLRSVNPKYKDIVVTAADKLITVGQVLG